MNFDEMDIEPKSEPPAGRRSSPQKFAKENKSHDEEPKWHQDSRPKYHNMEPHFSTVDNLMDDISKGQPLPPGMEDEITGPCQILKSLETFEHPLIGLEFLLELHNIVELKEPRYLCLLCDKRGDPRTILVHLTSQNHYLMYLRKYFRKFYSLIDKLPKSNECRGSVTSVTSHLIAKLEEKYGRLQPTATREDVVNVPEQRSMILQKIDGSVHFSESAEDAFLEDMLTIEYVQNPQLLQKNFPLKPKHATIEKPKEESKSLFNKISRNPSKKNIRNSRENTKNPREESPDVVFVGASRKPLSRNGRSRERSPRRIREMSLRRSRDRSPRRSRDMSLRRSRERSPHRVSERLPLRSRERSPLRGINRSPLRGVDRSPLRGIERSPLRSVNRSPMRGGVDRSPLRGIDRSPIRVIDRSPIRGIDRSPPRGVERSPLRGIDRSPIRAVERSPIRGVDRSPMRSRERSLLRGKERSPGLRMRSRSRHRSPSADRGRRRFISPSYYRSLRYQLSRSRSPQRHRSRSPHVERDRFYRRSPSPMSQMRARERSPMSSRYGGHRYRSPERSEREIRRVIVQRSPSPMSRSSEHASRYRGRSRSRERSPPFRGRRSRSRSRPRHELDVNSGPKPSVPVDSHSKPKEKGRADLNMNRAYIREAKEVEEKLNRDMEGYTETPESHPAYQDEWKKFWCAKFKEIQSEGKEDPHKYDYKPEWITFWNTRVKELFDEELKSKITALKSKYGISGEAKEDKSGEPKKTSAANSPGDDEKKPVIDIKTMWKELTGCEIKETPANAKRRSLSPWEDNDDVAGDKEAASKKDDAKKTSNLLLDEGSTPAISPVSLSSISDTESPRRPYRRTRSRSRSRSAQRSSRDYPFKEEYRKPPSKKIHFENPLNIITVLRQLSVLEFQLGSYASHVISLLTSGLTMERIKPQSSIDLLTKDNILFLELVKEKLKGQLLAGVVPKSMVKATLFCIKNTEELLQLVPKLKPTSPPPIPAPPPGLLYGAGVDPSQAPPGGSALAYGSHVYGHNYGGYPRPPFKHFNRKDRYPYRKPSPKRSEDAKTGRRISDEFPFRNNEPAAEQKPAAAVDEEIPIDKNLIALQIAEVLTQQGRSDVSNEELQALINTVVENLKQEQKMKAQQNNAAQLKDMTIPAVMNALSANAAAPANLGNVVAAAAAALTVPTIPAGFNLNDVSSSTLALLQDAYANVSVLSANQTSAIEDLSEADLIQMLRNFKSIPRVKQEKLIEYLRKLEVTNPERVEELKKYVNVL